MVFINPHFSVTKIESISAKISTSHQKGKFSNLNNSRERGVFLAYIHPSLCFHIFNCLRFTILFLSWPLFWVSVLHFNCCVSTCFASHDVELNRKPASPPQIPISVNGTTVLAVTQVWNSFLLLFHTPNFCGLFLKHVSQFHSSFSKFISYSPAQVLTIPLPGGDSIYLSCCFPVLP